jgi:hypothetical protein
MADSPSGSATTASVAGWRAIDGRGAFRRFRAEMHDEYPHLLPAWYAFRDNRARRRAVEWLADHSLIDEETASHYRATHPDIELP